MHAHPPRPRAPPSHTCARRLQRRLAVAAAAPGLDAGDHHLALALALDRHPRLHLGGGDVEVGLGLGLQGGAVGVGTLLGLGEVSRLKGQFPNCPLVASSSFIESMPCAPERPR